MNNLLVEDFKKSRAYFVVYEVDDKICFEIDNYRIPVDSLDFGEEIDHEGRDFYVVSIKATVSVVNRGMVFALGQFDIFSVELGKHAQIRGKLEKEKFLSSI